MTDQPIGSETTEQSGREVRTWRARERELLEELVRKRGVLARLAREHQLVMDLTQADEVLARERETLAELEQAYLGLAELGRTDEIFAELARADELVARQDEGLARLARMRELGVDLTLADVLAWQREELAELARGRGEVLAELARVHEALAEPARRDALAELARADELVARKREARAWLARMRKLEADLTHEGIPEGNQRPPVISGAGTPEPDANAVGNMPVSIYLADGAIHEQVETAVEQWLTTADVLIDTRAEPVIGSWFRRMEANMGRGARTPAGREALLTATHIADSRLVHSQDAYVTSTLLQNVGPVLQALQPTKDAVVRAGALLIVKVDWVVQVHQLTAAQQAILDHRPRLAASPKDVMTALQLGESDLQEDPLRRAVARAVGDDETATATGN